MPDRNAYLDGLLELDTRQAREFTDDSAAE
jgi:hypothetical protein